MNSRNSTSSLSAKRFYFKTGILILISLLLIIYLVAQTNLHISLQDLKNSADGAADEAYHLAKSNDENIRSNNNNNSRLRMVDSAKKSSGVSVRKRNAEAVDSVAKKKILAPEKSQQVAKTKKETHDEEIRRLQLEAVDQYFKRSQKRGRIIENNGQNVDLLHHRPGPGDELYERHLDKKHGDDDKAQQQQKEEEEQHNRENDADDADRFIKKVADRIADKEKRESAKATFDWAAFHKAREDAEMDARADKIIDEHRITRRPYEPLDPEICVATRTTMQKMPDFTRAEKEVRPRFAVVTMMARNGASADNATTRNLMAHYSFLNKILYCRQRGYDLIVEGDEAVDRSRAPAWSKIRVLRKWLPFYEWIVWVDMDTLFMNFEATIENLVNEQLSEYLKQEEKNHDMARQFGKNVNASERQIDLILASDWNGPNTGVQFIRNCPWSRKFLKLEWAVPMQYARPFWDQGALHWLLNVHRYHSGRDELRSSNDRSHVWFYSHVPRSYFNSYPPNFIAAEESIDAHQFVNGNWIAHFPSCRHFAVFCIPWFEKYFNRSLCENEGAVNAPRNFVAPAHYYPPGFDYSSSGAVDDKKNQSKNKTQDRPTFPNQRISSKLGDRNSKIDDDDDDDDDHQHGENDDDEVKEEIGDAPKVQGRNGEIGIVGGFVRNGEDTLNDFALRKRKEDDWKRKHDLVVLSKQRRKY